MPARIDSDVVVITPGGSKPRNSSTRLSSTTTGVADATGVVVRVGAAADGVWVAVPVAVWLAVAEAVGLVVCVARSVAVGLGVRLSTGPGVAGVTVSTSSAVPRSGGSTGAPGAEGAVALSTNAGVELDVGEGVGEMTGVSVSSGWSTA